MIHFSLDGVLDRLEEVLEQVRVIKAFLWDEVLKAFVPDLLDLESGVEHVHQGVKTF